MTNDAMSAMRASVEALWAQKAGGREDVLLLSQRMLDVVGDATTDVAYMVDALCVTYVTARAVGVAVERVANSRTELANLTAIRRLQEVKEELAPMLEHLVRFGHADASEAAALVDTMDAIVNRFEPFEGDVEIEPIRELQDLCMRVMFAAGYGPWSHAYSTKQAATLVSDIAKANGLAFNVSSMTARAAETRRNSKDDGSALQGVVLISRFPIVPPIDPSMGQEREPES